MRSSPSSRPSRPATWWSMRTTGSGATRGWRRSRSTTLRTTAVALRAAFVAAMAGLQVALICPTTLLARQHFRNFTERMQGFPIEVGRLSRLVPAAEVKKTKEGLEKGTVDIVIGTHALLAKTVKFRKLGLVIVD